MPKNVEELLDQIAALPDDETRILFVDELMHRFCMHCGREQPKSGHRCQCWNDE